ncbi:hypothetical protein LTS18_005241 [Coniosporium uncinatum]|uniref:Uncharacterized protein n=1 Tax=Coniosporium uncinatum TaxID=93489 RepID=A0ACC3D558_9PEZI|nr:hypothetical protein LTS18_005241 [Coniosporium uncinatum]
MATFTQSALGSPCYRPAALRATRFAEDSLSDTCANSQQTPSDQPTPPHPSGYQDRPPPLTVALDTFPLLPEPALPLLWTVQHSGVSTPPLSPPSLKKRKMSCHGLPSPWTPPAFTYKMQQPRKKRRLPYHGLPIPWSPPTPIEKLLLNCEVLEDAANLEVGTFVDGDSDASAELLMVVKVDNEP